MSEHFFGLGPDHLDHDIIDPIVEPLGAWLVNYTEPHGEKRHWFACHNRGEPFDTATARTVMAVLKSMGALERASAEAC